MIFQRFAYRCAAGATLLLATAFLAGCVNEYALDDLSTTKPAGDAFSKALFKDYSALAKSFGPVGVSAGVAFDRGGSIEMTEMNSAVGGLANDYAEKAIIAARGANVEPEPGIDVPTHKMRDRLIRALERGKEGYAVDAARAQADYDCWMMDNAVSAMRKAAERCHASLERSVAKLEGEAKAAPATPAPAPSDDSDKPAIQPTTTSSSEREARAAFSPIAFPPIPPSKFC
jgi:hypothetical protein